MCSATTTVRRNADGTISRVMPNLESSAEVYKTFLDLGFDGINPMGKSRAEMISQGKTLRIARKALQKVLPFLPALRYDYPRVMRHFYAPEDSWNNVFPTLFPQWDRTPRAGKHEGIYVNTTPQNFGRHIEDALRIIKDKPQERKILFLRSWNEWGEGNYVEPDTKYGHGFIDAIKNKIK